MSKSRPLDGLKGPWGATLMDTPIARSSHVLFECIK